MQDNQINNLKNRIFGKSKEHNIINVYHYLMIHYGYIPFDDFKKMDAFLVDELVRILNEMNEKANKFIPKRLGRKR